MSDKPSKDADRDVTAEFSDVLRAQKEKQERLRHVQEFVTTPTFLDFAQMSVEVSDDPEQLEARRRDITYRIEILRSVLGLLEDELEAMDRVSSVQERDKA
ncbi:hypothetical protein SAMN05421853_102433 [Roseivivax halotolerans]|uniref:Uncharacterized protein n=2 Tax=Roseivivax halotolerans TaxID=93684 RepID=A0A1I5WM82_9RHOB|nr:hypothetical protein [Roseivivax sp. THAF30]QFT64325.1 hypothetical protein FIU91_15410 [Roseivivax sp. THAF30]SFQ20697.1 hypothetical protein SAMN05421853_102433 [Roseivivax halotolerans]